jgi:integrase
MATRNRIQSGSIILRSGNWYTRYWSGPKADRKLVSHKLAVKSDVYYSEKSVALKKLNAAHMAIVNSSVPVDNATDQLPISTFYEQTYIKWVEAHKKPSTLHSYKQIWNQHLKKHFGKATLSEYQTSDAYKFLNQLADSGLGRNAISHVRSLMSGIFSKACNRGLIKFNPISEVEIDSKMKAPKTAEAYSLRQVEDFISALVERPDLQLLVALQAYLGLRPSECSGLAWDCVDFKAGEIHLRRGVVRNVIGDLKTKGSVATLPIIEPVGSLLQAVHKAGARTWVFENSAGRPADLKALVWRFIRPAIEKWNTEHGPENQIKWVGLYGLRRSAASFLWSLTAGTEASQLLLRHTTPATVNKHYLVADRSKLTAGLKMLEAKIGGKN